MTDDPAPLLQLESLTVGYGPRMPVVHDLALSIAAGSFVVIVGPNGCGKSTLLRAIARLLEPTRGEIVLDGRDIRERKPREYARMLGMLPQGSSAPDGIRVVDLVARGRYPHRSPFTGWSAADERAVDAALEATGIRDLVDRDVDTLSGGQRQRVWLAMALAQDTPTLLLDEPTTYHDLAHQYEVLELFREINTIQGRTIVAVLHDLNQAARYADRIVALRDGRVVLDGAPAQTLTAASVEAVFDFPCRVIPDPETGTPLIIPRVETNRKDPDRR